MSNKNTFRTIKLLQKIGLSELILSAGMQRSGSTLLFNIIREIIIQDRTRNLSSGYINDYNTLSKSNCYLVKTHTLPFLLKLRSNHIIYSFRDVRTALVSQHKKFDHSLDYGFVSYCINEYKIAKNSGALMLKYEKLIENPTDAISNIAELLSVNVDAANIWQSVNTLPEPQKNEFYSSTTLFHHNHRTGTKNDDWRHEFPPELAHKINQNFKWWFQECDYPES